MNDRHSDLESGYKIRLIDLLSNAWLPFTGFEAAQIVFPPTIQ